MYLSQPSTHKFNPSTREIILKYLTKPYSAKEFAAKHGLKQSLVSQSMYNLWQEGALYREICRCGKGFIYKLHKHKR